MKFDPAVAYNRCITIRGDIRFILGPLVNRGQMDMPGGSSRKRARRTKGGRGLLRRRGLQSIFYLLPSKRPFDVELNLSDLIFVWICEMELAVNNYIPWSSYTWHVYETWHFSQTGAILFLMKVLYIGLDLLKCNLLK